MKLPVHEFRLLKGVLVALLAKMPQNSFLQSLYHQMSLVRIEDASEPVELKVSEGEVAALVGYTREYAATLPQHYPQSHREMQAALAGVIRHMQYQRCEFCGSMDLYSFIQISCYNIPLSGTCRVCFYRPLQELYIMRNHLHL